MKKAIGFPILALIVFFGCYIQNSTTQAKGELTEIIVNTKKALASVTQNTFCLHVRYSNNFYYLYSENYAEGWVTEGDCNTDGPRRSVENIGLGWHYKGEGQSNKQCSGSDSCSFSERNYGIGKTIECVVAAAHDGNLSAYNTTDPIGCR